MTAKKKLTGEQRRKIYCVKNGHSRIRDFCFGYHHCARCGDQLGDSLGGAYSDEAAVYISHMHTFMHKPKEFSGLRGCHCPQNAKKIMKKDLALMPQWNAYGQEMRPPWRERPPPAQTRKGE